MANKNLAEYRADFMAKVGDTSLTTTVCDYWLKKSYKDIWKLVWNNNARRELPIAITQQTPIYDTTRLSYYVKLSDTILAWRFPNNQQISQWFNGTDYQIYLAKNNTKQQIESLNTLNYPTLTNQSGEYGDIMANIVILDASYRYLDSIKSYDEADRKRAQRTEAIQELNQKYAQQFIYNENDGYEELKVNLP